MFQQFFGLRAQPFGVTPDPRFLYLAPAHREALASLLYGIEANRGFLALIARPGMGKTTLLFHLLEKFRHRARTAFLFQTQCNSREFMRFLLEELAIKTEGKDFVQMHEAFNRCLLQEARAGNRFIIVIDEAQNLDPSVLETVRLLSDFETPQAKLLQIILAGQPELAGKLADPRLNNLHQRITSFSGLKTLTQEETKQFIAHRLRVAGYQGDKLFSPDAMGMIWELSSGIPRSINNLCFHSLSLAFAMRTKTITLPLINEVAEDLDVRRLFSDEDSLLAHAGPHAHFGVEHPAAVAPKVPAAVPVASTPIPSAVRGKDTLSPTEAKVYMQTVNRMLTNWRRDHPSEPEPAMAREIQ